MLIIRRRRGESIVIREYIEIEILETSSTQVKLGITAPKDVSVLRSEIRVTRDVNRSASAQLPDSGQLTQFAERIRENIPPAEPSSPDGSTALPPGDPTPDTP